MEHGRQQELGRQAAGVRLMQMWICGLSERNPGITIAFGSEATIVNGCNRLAPNQD